MHFPRKPIPFIIKKQIVLFFIGTMLKDVLVFLVTEIVNQNHL